jgi:hypothetical protein
MDHDVTMSLGPIPWSDEQITALYFQDFRALDEAMKRHPGHAAASGLEELQFSLSVFEELAQALLDEIQHFREAAEKRRLFAPKNRTVLESQLREVRKLLFLTVVAAWALVDHCRRVTRFVSVPDFASHRAAVFDPGLHEVMRGLRQCAAHVVPPDPHWRTRYDEMGVQVGFVLHLEDMPVDWTADARTYLSANPDADVETLVRAYREQVRSFYAWFLPRTETHGGEPLRDYRKCVNLIQRIGFQSSWRLLLQADPSDPAIVRKRFIRGLTCAEAREVLRLPSGSAKQAVRIIELLDEDQQLDEELRRETLQRFGVAGSDAG